jgi:hypothetical protein
MYFFGYGNFVSTAATVGFNFSRHIAWTFVKRNVVLPLDWSLTSDISTTTEHNRRRH